MARATMAISTMVTPITAPRPETALCSGALSCSCDEREFCRDPPFGADGWPGGGGPCDCGLGSLLIHVSPGGKLLRVGVDIVKGGCGRSAVCRPGPSSPQPAMHN